MIESFEALCCYYLCIVQLLLQQVNMYDFFEAAAPMQGELEQYLLSTIKGFYVDKSTHERNERSFRSK